MSVAKDKEHILSFLSLSLKLNVYLLLLFAALYYSRVHR